VAALPKILQENKIMSPNDINQNEIALGPGQSLFFSLGLMDDDDNKLTGGQLAGCP